MKKLLPILLLPLLTGCFVSNPSPREEIKPSEYITVLAEEEKVFETYEMESLETIRECAFNPCPENEGIWMSAEDFAILDKTIDDLFHFKSVYEDVIALKDEKINQMVEGWSETDMASQKNEEAAERLERALEKEEKWGFVKESFYQTIIGVMSIVNFIK